jgi:amidase
MQHTIGSKDFIFSFSDKNAPVLNAEPGDELVIETQDCFSNQINNPEDRLEQLDWDRINPATGPVFIRGAAKGDTLKVTIKKIEINDMAVVATGKDMGLFGGLLPDTYVRILSVKDGSVHFSDTLSLPVKSMIGVIGVAPENQAISCGTPGSHGGNMDNTMIGEGATIYFPVFCEGALFALGDVHAVMGDGEVCVSGAETRAKVTVAVDLLKGKKLNNPVVENAEFFATIAAEESLDKAVCTSAIDMYELLKNATQLRDEEIAMLLSLSGNVEICQVVDPKKTARFVVPKKVLRAIAFSF